VNRQLSPNPTQRSFEQQLLNNVLHSSLALEELRELIAKNATALQDESGAMDTTLEQSSEAISFLDQVNEVVTEMSNDTETARESAEESVELSGNITGLASQIKQISMKTNLISLNASVEAARAGDAGKGFSVIAQEVRELALSAKEASQSISDFAKEIGQCVGRVDLAVGTINQKLGHLSTSATQLNDTMRSSVDGSTRMIKVLSETTSETFIRTVKMDHIVWKNAVYRVINKTSDAAISTFADHKGCRLGKWYLDKGARLYGHLHVFKEIDEPHDQVHRSGIEALQADQEGQPDDCLAHLQRMERSSEVVINLLSRLEQQMLKENNK